MVQRILVYTSLGIPKSQSASFCMYDYFPQPSERESFAGTIPFYLSVFPKIKGHKSGH